jgi:hypothetical protein
LAVRLAFPHRNLLVLFLALLSLSVIGVAPASATGTLDIAVVRGTDNGIYWNSYNSLGQWGSWVSLVGSTLSPPGICEAVGLGYVYVVVRGTDNGVYVRLWIDGLWSGWVSPPGGGRTIDQPACARLGTNLFVVVRGMNNELYWDSLIGGTWQSWVDLHGASASVPVLVSTPGLSRLDLFVQGMDNGIYHKAYTLGSWSSSWDTPGGATTSKPAAALFTMISECPTSGCIESDSLLLVVRGTDNNVYSNSFLIGTGWLGWSSLSGATLSAPTLTQFANGCFLVVGVNCNSIVALAVRGTDNAVYHKTFSGMPGSWSGSWDSPGGAIANSPALAYVPVNSGYAKFLLLVEGYPSKISKISIYSNTVTASGSTWGTWVSVGGATPSDPQLVAVL